MPDLTKARPMTRAVLTALPRPRPTTWYEPIFTRTDFPSPFPTVPTTTAPISFRKNYTDFLSLICWKIKSSHLRRWRADPRLAVCGGSLPGAGFNFDQGKFGETYCVGGGVQPTNLEVAKNILKLLGLGEDKIEFVKDRLGHDRRYAIDYSKIKKNWAGRRK